MMCSFRFTGSKMEMRSGKERSMRSSPRESRESSSYTSQVLMTRQNTNAMQGRPNHPACWLLSVRKLWQHYTHLAFNIRMSTFMKWKKGNLFKIFLNKMVITISLEETWNKTWFTDKCKRVWRFKNTFSYGFLQRRKLDSPRTCPTWMEWRQTVSNWSVKCPSQVQRSPGTKGSRSCQREVAMSRLWMEREGSSSSRTWRWRMLGSTPVDWVLKWRHPLILNWTVNSVI